MGGTRRTTAVIAAVGVLFLAGCSGGGEEPGEDPTADPTAEESAPVEDDVVIRIPESFAGLSGFIQRVAVDRGHYEDAGVEVDVVTVGETEDNILLLSGRIDMAPLSALDVATMRADDEDVTILSPLFSQYAEILVKADDDRTIDELVGAKIGDIGPGSTTSKQLQVVLKVLEDIDYTADFEHVVSGTPTLGPFLDRGEVDAIAIFPPISAALRSTGDYRTVFGPLSSVWEEESGQPLMLSGIAMRGDFVAEHPDAVARFVEGLRAAEADINENAEELVREYADLFGLDSEEGIAEFLAQLEEGPYFDTSFDDDRRAAELEFLDYAVEAGVLESVPEGVFAEGFGD
ncbi:MAG: transporter substrate-binding protein [Actinotalea sp.]|nr:transporter substrate-binding protein [Actinotalea sp.]